MRYIVNFFIVAAFLMLQACSKPISPDFKEVSNISINVNNFSEATISGDALFYNPNKKKIVIKSAEIDIMFEEKLVGKIDKEFDLEVTPESDFSVPISINVPVKDLSSNSLSAALGMLTGAEKEIGFEGNVKIKMYGVVFPIQVKHREKVSLN